MHRFFSRSGIAGICVFALALAAAPALAQAPAAGNPEGPDKPAAVFLAGAGAAWVLRPEPSVVEVPVPQVVSERPSQADTASPVAFSGPRIPRRIH